MTLQNKPSYNRVSTRVCLYCTLDRATVLIFIHGGYILVTEARCYRAQRLTHHDHPAKQTSRGTQRLGCQEVRRSVRGMCRFVSATSFLPRNHGRSMYGAILGNSRMSRIAFCLVPTKGIVVQESGVLEVGLHPKLGSAESGALWRICKQTDLPPSTSTQPHQNHHQVVASNIGDPLRCQSRTLPPGCIP
jgi:hypothetical protein